MRQLTHPVFQREVRGRFVRAEQTPGVPFRLEPPAFPVRVPAFLYAWEFFSDRTATLSGLAAGFSALAGFPVGLLVGLFFLTATGAGFLRTTFLAGRGVFFEDGDTDRRGLAAFFIAFFAIFLFR